MDGVRHTLGLFSATFVVSALVPMAQAGNTTLPKTQAGRHNSWVIIDLDGDRQSDFASAGSSRRDGCDYVQEINLGLSSFARDTVTVRTHMAGERLTARDLDGDADRDLVLESFGEPIAVLLNDGNGHFHQADLADYFFQLSHRTPRGFQ
jgi:hypothetical protein